MSKSHWKGSLEKVSKENSVKPELHKGEIEHSVDRRNNLVSPRHIWGPYFRLDLLCLAFIFGRHFMELQNVSGFCIKDCLTEASLG